MTMYVKDGRTFRQACKFAGVTFWSAYDKIRLYGMSPDDAIRYCQSLKGTYKCRGDTLRQYCIKHKAPYNSILKYLYEGGKESFEEIVDKKLYLKQRYTDLQFCKDYNINYNNAKSRHYYAITFNNCNKSFKDFCKDIYHLHPYGVL